MRCVPTSAEERILSAVRAIPKGFVRTYGDLSPGAPRLAGRVLRNSSAPVPWWRVVRADGSLPLGEDQRKLLDAEGVPLLARDPPRVDMRTARLAGAPAGQRDRSVPAAATVMKLRNGARVEIRPIEPSDKRELAAGFERLSELSRYRRFLSPTAHLTDKQLTYLTDVDHGDHEALVAMDAETGNGVAVARYVRSSAHADEAEAAVVVADDWQRRGLGTALLRRLAARAREEGIASFTALVSADNEPVRHMLDALGTAEQHHAGGGALEVSLRLPVDPIGSEHERRLAGWLRAAATGVLRPTLRGLHRGR